MNRRHWTRYLMIVSLSLNLGIVGALLWPPSKPQPTGNPASPAPLNLQDHLELNTEQRTRWQALEPAFLQELAANWQAIRQHREALVRHIFAATPDRAAIGGIPPDSARPIACRAGDGAGGLDIRAPATDPRKPGGV